MANQKYYIGVHSTYKVNDNYLGSGTLIEHAIKKYGKCNFTREILSFYKTRDEALCAERDLITKEIIKDDMSYNLVPGGEGNPILSVWGGSHAERIRKLFSNANKGYINFDFISRWKPLYDKVLCEFLLLLKNTTLPDRVCLDIVCKNIEVNIKLHSLLKYAKYQNLISKKTKIEKSYVTTGYPTPMLFTERDMNNLISVKGLNFNYLNNFKKIIDLLNDKTITDSMLINNSINTEFGKSINGHITYFKYLGILTSIGSVRVSNRIRFPDSQRATGKKTLYKICPEEIFNYTFLEIKNDNSTRNKDYNFYKANYNGESFQFIPVRLEDHANWRIDRC